MERKVGSATIKVHRGDITALRVDAIVNAANDRLWMGGGVAGAIKRAGGAEIEREAVAQGPIRVGDAVVTGAGALPCRYVIHAATMGQDLVTSAEAIRAATASSLARADELGLASVAFPALGTGVGGFPLAEAARLMVEEIVAHLRGPTHLREVVLAAFSDEAADAFAAALAARLPGSGGEGDPDAHVVVFITASSADEAARIGRTLVAERLAACANLIPSVSSTYWWQGKMEDAAEALVVLKTRRTLIAPLAARVRALHSYTVPEVIALPIVGGNPDYLRWIDDSTSTGTE